MIIKTLIRYLSKHLSILFTSFRHNESDLVILMYHRVTGDIDLEIDIEFLNFEKQIVWLRDNYNVISLDKATEIFKSEISLNYSRKSVVITFDDAFEDFYTHAWPLLKKFNLPSTLYVPTEFINNHDKVPISSPITDLDKLKPMTWDMLREVMKDPLVTIAAHSHTHSEFSKMTASAIEQEVIESKNNFQTELGFIPRHFAYPRGAWNIEAKNTVKKYYKTISLVGGGGVNFAKLKLLEIPRVPILKSDGFKFFKYRLQERLKFDELIADIIKKRNR